MKQFNEMGLGDPVMKAINDLGFIEPTPIQEKVIPQILKNTEDLIALAQTGTGKTAAFGLPLVQMSDPEVTFVQGLVLCPTRELCMQITGDLQDFAKYSHAIQVIPVYGGASIDKQIQRIKKGGQIIVGTPGRVRDLIERKVLKIQSIKWLVLDEADEMLQMGFKEELDAILEGTPGDKQTLLFSATMPEGVYRIANTYMNNPGEIAVGTKNAGAENVVHEYYMAHAKNRYEVLKRVADMHPDIYGIVFCRTRQETKEVADRLMTDGYDADALHGDLTQAQRDYVMNRFRKRQLQMLIATDVAARGLDVTDLSHVINYNLPDDLEVYIHRSGRTGRAGRNGTSISIIHTRETGKIKALEKLTRKPFNRVMIAGGKEICTKQLFNLVNKMENVQVNEQQINEFLPEIYKKLEWLSKEELIKKFVSLEFNRFLEYYRNAPDLNVEADRKSQGKEIITNGFRDREKRSRNRNDMTTEYRREKIKSYTRFYVNLGSRNELNPTRLIGLILDSTNDRGIDIGKIDIMKGFSFFEVDQEYSGLVTRSFSRNIRFGGTLVKVELAQEKDTRGQNDENVMMQEKNHGRKKKQVRGAYNKTTGSGKNKNRKGKRPVRSF